MPMPAATACWKVVLKAALSVAPVRCLRLTVAHADHVDVVGIGVLAGCSGWRSVRQILPRGSAQAALTIEALGAAAVAHSTSIAASTSSPLMPSRRVSASSCLAHAVGARRPWVLLRKIARRISAQAEGVAEDGPVTGRGCTAPALLRRHYSSTGWCLPPPRSSCPVRKYRRCTEARCCRFSADRRARVVSYPPPLV